MPVRVKKQPADQSRLDPLLSVSAEVGRRYAADAQCGSQVSITV
jgi:hypothetical protein